MDTGLLHRSCWLEIDLTAVKNNMLAMKRMVGPGILVMPAVKANAYGHGIVACCRALQDAGADILGVGNVDDAILLRRSGLVMPLLVFAGNTVSEAAELYVAHNLMPTILSVEQAKSISAAAHIPHPVFIKIETGFGRLGVNAEAAAEVIRDIAALPNIRIDGIYSHMGGADWPEDDADATEDYFLWQYQRFGTVLKKMKEFNIAVPFRQLANTPGSIVYPGIRMTGICPGRAVWGYSPVERRAGHPDIAMAMTAWKSRLIQVKEVIGGRFGPGGAHIRLEKPRRVGVLAGGLSDGVSLHQAGGSVLIRGKRVPVLGPVFLEHTSVDLDACPEAAAGDEALILGRQGNEEIGLEELLQRWNRTLEEFWTALPAGLTRVYFENGAPVAVGRGEQVEWLERAAPSENGKTLRRM